MEITYRERVDKALELLGKGLSPFVERELKAVLGNKWQEPAQELGKDRKQVNWVDPQVLLNVICNQWNSVFGRTLDQPARSIVNELRVVRNRFSHYEALPGDDAYRALDRVCWLLMAVSAPEAAEAAQMRWDLLQVLFDERREVKTPHLDVPSGRAPQFLSPEDSVRDFIKRKTCTFPDQGVAPEQFVGRMKLIEKLEQLTFHGKRDRGIILISAAPGQGKTSLLTRLARLWRVRIPVPASFFYSQTSGLTDPDDCIGHIFAALLKSTAETNLGPTGPANDGDDLFNQFQQFLEETVSQQLAPDHRQVLLIDALDEAKTTASGKTAYQRLPHNLPRGVFVIATTRETSDAKDLDVEVLKDLGDADNRSPNLWDARKFANRELTERIKEEATRNALVDEIVRASAGNFLVLKHLCKASSRIPSLDKVPDFLRELSSVPEQSGLAQFYVRFWRRMNANLSIEKAECVAQTAAFICAGEGVSETILCECLNISTARCGPALEALSEFVTDYRNDIGERLYRIYHQSFADFLNDKLAHECRKARERLADYCRDWSKLSGFEREYSLRFGVRRLCEAGRWVDLENRLTDLRYVDAKSRANMAFELADDYERVVRQHPNWQRVTKQRTEWDERLQKWIAEIVQWQATVQQLAQNEQLQVPKRNLVPPVPKIDFTDVHDAIEHAAKPDSADNSYAITSRLEAFRAFVLSHVHILAKFPTHVFPLARNYTSKSSLGEDAEFFADEFKEPWVECLDRPDPYSSGSAIPRLVGQLPRLVGHDANITCLALSGDGKHAATADKKGRICYWDLQTGKMLHDDRVPTEINDLKISLNGRRMVAACADGIVRVWDLPDLKLTQELAGHEGRVNCVSCLPDGSLALSSSEDGSICSWNLESGKKLTTLSDNDGIQSVAWAIGKNKELVGIIGRGVSRYYVFPIIGDWKSDNSTDDEALKPGSDDESPSTEIDDDKSADTSISDDQFWVLENRTIIDNCLASVDGSVELDESDWSIAWHEVHNSLRSLLPGFDQEGEPKSLVAITRDGRFIWVARGKLVVGLDVIADSTAEAVADAARAEAASQEPDQAEVLHSLRLAMIAEASNDSAANASELAHNRPVPSETTIDASPDPKVPFESTEQRCVELVSMRDEMKSFPPPTAGMVACFFPPEKRRQIEMEFQPKFRVQGVPTQKSINLADTPDGTIRLRICLQGLDHVYDKAQISLCDTASGAVLHASETIRPLDLLRFTIAQFLRFTMAPSGHFAAFTTYDEYNEQSHSFGISVTDGRLYDYGKSRIAYCTPDFQSLITLVADEAEDRVFVYRTNEVHNVIPPPVCEFSTRLSRTFEDDDDWDFGVWYCNPLLSPNGRVLAIANQDQRIELWSLLESQPTRPFATLDGHRSTVCSLAFTPDGKWLLSTGGDKTLRLWDVATGSCRVVQPTNELTWLKRVDHTGDVFDLRYGFGVEQSAPVFKLRNLNIVPLVTPTHVVRYRIDPEKVNRAKESGEPAYASGECIANDPDNKASVVCPVCRDRFDVPNAVMLAIEKLTDGVSPPQSLNLPDSAFEDLRLEFKCGCGQRVRANPFVV